METNETVNGINFFRIDNDLNGNPRYVIHFLALSNNYSDAVKLANKLGGRKYTAKWFGGGLVFQAYSLPHLAEKINLIKTN